MIYCRNTYPTKTESIVYLFSVSLHRMRNSRVILQMKGYYMLKKKKLSKTVVNSTIWNLMRKELTIKAVGQSREYAVLCCKHNDFVITLISHVFTK